MTEAPERERPHVIMATEGTYPFMGGGVSTWCHQLCDGLTSADYTILAVTGAQAAKWKYDRKEVVHRAVQIPMWPGEEPVVYLRPGKYSKALEYRRASTDEIVEQRFKEPLRILLREIFIGGVDLETLVGAIVDAGLFAREYDFKEAMRSRVTWQVFIDSMDEFTKTVYGERSPVPTVADVTICARWFYNMLMPLATPRVHGTVFHATIASACALPGIIDRAVYGTSFLLTDHGVYLRERYIAISSSDFPAVQKKFLVGIAILVGRACYATADIISPVALFNSRWELPWGAPKERIKVIYNGVETDKFAPGPKPDNENKDRPVAVAAARVFPLKDVKTMIRAAAVSREKMPEVLYLCYGSLKADPPYVESCREIIADLGLENNFKFGGFHPDPFGIFIEGDISVLSSISEGFPYTVLEAMSSGIPCVATDVGGVKEAVGDTGIVVPPVNPQALGEAVVELLSDNTRRRKLARAARERVVNNFTIAKQLGGYEDLYFQLHDDTKSRKDPREGLCLDPR